MTMFRIAFKRTVQMNKYANVEGWKQQLLWDLPEILYTFQIVVGGYIVKTDFYFIK